MLVELHRQARRFWLDDSGPTATEYAVMLALIIAVCVTSITALGTGLKTSVETSRTAMFP
ncbi:MAG: Flp family type IVb pilin [Phycisphaerales bacterium]|nr:Flp family type IVb pilin [Phycisphaerales bacterium]